MRYKIERFTPTDNGMIDYCPEGYLVLYEAHNTVVELLKEQIKVLRDRNKFLKEQARVLRELVIKDGIPYEE